jgi:hypothetical protein
MVQAAPHPHRILLPAGDVVSLIFNQTKRTCWMSPHTARMLVSPASAMRVVSSWMAVAFRSTATTSHCGSR